MRRQELRADRRLKIKTSENIHGPWYFKNLVSKRSNIRLNIVYYSGLNTL